MRIPFLDLARLHDSIRAELDRAFDRCVRSSSFVGDGAVRSFEEEFAAACGRRAAAGCGSGTDALHLTLRALGIGPGDEVIVPSMTFVATGEAVVHAGATPVVADVHPETLLLDEASVAAVRSDRTRAVVAVHLYGHVVPFPLLRRWRDEGLAVIEDAAQAHLASWEGEPVGTVGNAACFSFFPGKNLGALGDAGAVVSDDEALVEEVARLRDHGRSAKYVHDVVGFCSRMDGVQAAFLSVKLRHLPVWNERRRELAERYRRRLGEAMVPWSDGAVHHLAVVRVAERDRVRLRLAEAGIETGVHYPVPLSRQPSLARWARPTPAAERAAGEVLSLPLDPLMGGREVDAVCDALEHPGA
jgi:dTDP-4-amino-4,6-dideoxygalactose transaminase